MTALDDFVGFASDLPADQRESDEEAHAELLEALFPEPAQRQMIARVTEQLSEFRGTDLVSDRLCTA